MKCLLPLVVFLLTLTSCVGGKLDPKVAPIVGILDTAGCEVVTIYVKDQEAGDVCKAASNFFNNILANFSAPAAASKSADKNVGKFPVTLRGVTVGHFRKPFDSMMQSKLDALPSDKPLNLN